MVVAMLLVNRFFIINALMEAGRIPIDIIVLVVCM